MLRRSAGSAGAAIEKGHAEEVWREGDFAEGMVVAEGSTRLAEEISIIGVNR